MSSLSGLFKRSPNVMKLKEKKEYNKLAELLTYDEKTIRIESAKALLDAILAPALGSDHFNKFEIAKLFRAAEDEEVLDLLLEHARKYGNTGKPEYGPLIRAILYANGFDRLLELLIENGKGNLVGNWNHKTLTESMFAYASARRFGIDIFVKIIPNAKCDYSEDYQMAREYFKSLPSIELQNAEIGEIQTLIDRRREETKQDANVVVQGYNRMDELLLEKIISI